ncbi:MAG: hypothetical protein ACRDAU_07220 [Clostridium sp.]
MKYVRELIEYVGIMEKIPENIEAFKEITLDKKFILEAEKTSINKFLKCVMKSTILESKLIKGNAIVSIDGKLLDGIRYVIKGNFLSRVEYIGDDGRNIVYTDRKSIPYTIEVPLNSEYLNCNTLIVNCFLDDIYLEKLNEREYIISISGIITVED